MNKEILPRYLYRPSDLEPFVLENGRYYLERSFLESPFSSPSYTFDHLKSVGFTSEKSKITDEKSKTKGDHLSEFWHSFYASIEAAHGNVGSFHGGMTLREVADQLAQNNIRFYYKAPK